MKKFARSQVEHLSRRLEYEKSLSIEIVRTRAMREYDVSAAYTTPWDDALIALLLS